MAVTARRDSLALIHALADLAGRPVPEAESVLILDRARTLSVRRANEIWSQHRRAPATVSMRDYLAMTLRFLDQGCRRLVNSDPAASREI